MSSHEFLFETALTTSNKFRDLISQSGPGVSLSNSPVGFGYALVASYEAAVVFFDYLGSHFRRWNLNLPVESVTVMSPPRNISDRMSVILF